MTQHERTEPVPNLYQDQWLLDTEIVSDLSALVQLLCKPETDRGRHARQQALRGRLTERLGGGDSAVALIDDLELGILSYASRRRTQAHVGRES